MGAYEDILHLPHHRSEKHPPMSMRDRAAQFSSFRALTGYEDALGETARLTDERIERSEEEQQRLDAILQHLERRLPERPAVTVTYFRPDDRKAGGAYLQHTGSLRTIDRVNGRLVFADKWTVALEDVYDLWQAAETNEKRAEPGQDG